MTALPEHQSAPGSAGDSFHRNGVDGDDTDWAGRSAFGTIRGMPWWGAVVLATLLTALGTLLDVLIRAKPGILFTACYVVGCLLAIALVRRRSLFGPMVQPPLVLAVAMPAVVLLVGSGTPEGSGTTATVLAMVSPLITGFPTMAGTTGAVLGVGLLRMFVLERGPADRRGGRGSGKNSEAATKKTTRSSAGRSPRETPSGGRQKQAANDGKKRPPEGASKQRSPGKSSRSPAANSEADQRAPGRPQRGKSGGNAASGQGKPSAEAGKQRPRPGVGAGNASDSREARPRGQGRGEQSPSRRTPKQQGGQPRGRPRGEQPPQGGSAPGGQPPGRARGNEAHPERGDRSNSSGRGNGARPTPPGRAKPPERPSEDDPPRRPRRPRRQDD